MDEIIKKSSSRSLDVPSQGEQVKYKYREFSLFVAAMHCQLIKNYSLGFCFISRESLTKFLIALDKKS